MADFKENLYELLEVEEGADIDAIKASYKRLVRKFHPDINKAKGADIKFKLINSAYKTLSDFNKKQEYDLFISNKKTVKTPNEESVIKETVISSYEQIKGSKRTVNILNAKICPKCGGKKYIKGVKCAFCLGEGKKSEHKKIEVEIPSGIKEGEFVYVGKIGGNNVFPKELFLKIKTAKAQEMFLEKGKIVFLVELPVYDTILGVEKEISINNKEIKKIKIPPFSKHGDRIKLNFQYEKKDCYAQIEVIFPKTISNEEKNLYDRIRKINSEKKDVCKNKGNF